MRRHYWKTKEERATDRKRLAAIRKEVLAKVPGCAVAADQAYREADLAIDFCEDVPPLSREAVQEIVECFTRARHRQDQFDPCQRLVRRLRQARHEPPLFC